ncbi:Rha family transcriptional regulator [uncultured Acidaminococcus sp.]|jgi:Rha family phage regulatory protein|uniref:Regulatory protein n=1 Tax=Siphoviridae sp. ctx7r16 TaxID=2825738 RepID=A0A8S5NVL6_9CAUD|nr:Rha family transcriptional regulator [uncultured Acidaminococcus sp.]DAD98798.1 MAG TPA: regulatory protein [Siphoviridae sp. ctx7r16]
MKFLVPEDEFGVFADQGGVARVDSLFVAATFEKQHYNVLRDIGRITASNSGLSPEFIALNFEGNTYRDARGRKLPRYLLTRDGFTMLVMGYTGPKAMHFKELYIQRFNEMEQCVRSLLSARQEFPMLTEMICRLHESPKAYHFSNEADMLNRIVLGMSAKQFRLANGIEKGQSIRPYLTAKQIHALDRLQHLDYGLLYSCPDFQQRKQLLMAYYKTELEV